MKSEIPGYGILINFGNWIDLKESLECKTYHLMDDGNINSDDISIEIDDSGEGDEREILIKYICSNKEDENKIGFDEFNELFRDSFDDFIFKLISGELAHD